MTANNADTTRAVRPRRAPFTGPEEFYNSGLSQAERERLSQARRMEGVDEEIALLRVKLHTAINAMKDGNGYDRADMELMMKGISLLVRAVAARYKLSHEAEDELAANMASVIRGVGGLLMPERFGDEA